MTASDANLVGMYDQGLGVQPDVVEAHMVVDRGLAIAQASGSVCAIVNPMGVLITLFARRSRAGDRVTSPVPVPTLQDRAGPLLATRNLRLGPRTYVLNDPDRVKSRRQECLGSISQRRVTTAFGKMRHGTHIR